MKMEFYKAVGCVMLFVVTLYGHSVMAAPTNACEDGKMVGQVCEDPVPEDSVDNKKAQGMTDEEMTAELISPTSSGFPATSCRAGYFAVGTRLCMTGRRGPTSYANAAAYCQAIRGTVANYGAWRYRILYGDGIAAPVGWWLGPITADNQALYVNSSNTGDFDGVTSRFNSRYYVCAHDDI